MKVSGSPLKRPPVVDRGKLAEQPGILERGDLWIEQQHGLRFPLGTRLVGDASTWCTLLLARSAEQVRALLLVGDPGVHELMILGHRAGRLDEEAASTVR